ncbi:MAG: TIGR02147 family protein, partial [Fibrobacteres bacterium]|nr:TIGR02147 family protein [Fibrobacterota bacterium]
MKKAIFEFLDYRDYLKEVISSKKEKTPSFSFRLLGKKIGLKSPAFIAAVVNGTRSLSDGLAIRLATVLNLRNREREYFVHLVRYNEAKTREEKEFFLMQLMNYRKEQRIKSINLDHCEVYREWYYLAVREIVNLPDFKPDPEWIAAKLSPTITPTQAARSLELLSRLELIKNDKGKWVQSEPLLWQETESVSDARMLIIRDYHRKMISLSKEAL